jgi:hypothetical protein
MAVIIPLAVAGVALLSAIGYNVPKVATQDYVAEVSRGIVGDNEAHEREDAAAFRELSQYLAQVDMEQKTLALESYDLRALQQEEVIKKKEKAGEDPTINKQQLEILNRRKKSLDGQIQRLLNPNP